MKENWAAIQLPTPECAPLAPSPASRPLPQRLSSPPPPRVPTPQPAATARPQPSTTAPHLRRRLSLHSRPSHPPPQVPPPPRHTSAAARPLLAGPHLFCRAPRNCTLCPPPGVKEPSIIICPANRQRAAARPLPGAESTSIHSLHIFPAPNQLRFTKVSVYLQTVKSCALL